MSTNLSIGGGSLQSCTQREVNGLLSKAIELGINNIDTAPLYLNSESLLGNFPKLKNNFEISTKVGRPLVNNFGQQDVIKSVERSLKLLKVDTISTIFIHSIDFNMVSDEILEALKTLKFAGKIRNIGYSGDNLDLKKALELDIFDSYMFTLNFLDLKNLELISNSEKINQKLIHIKRPIANRIWKTDLGMKKDKLIGIIRGKRVEISPYQERFDNLYGSGAKFITKDFLRLSLDYVKAKSFIDYITVGTKNVSHLSEINRIFNDSSQLSSENVLEIESKFRLASNNSWPAIT